IFVDVTKLRAVEAAAFGFEIGDLASNQFLASGRGRDLTENFWQRIAPRQSDRRGNLKRDREQRVAGENGDAFAKNFVTRRAAAAEIVVIHAREIVVYERIGVDAFDRAGERQRGIDFAAARFRRGEAKNRAEPFAAREQTVTHRLVNGGRWRRFLRQKTIKGAIDFFLPG